MSDLDNSKACFLEFAPFHSYRVTLESGLFPADPAGQRPDRDAVGGAVIGTATFVSQSEAMAYGPDAEVTNDLSFVSDEALPPGADICMTDRFRVIYRAPSSDQAGSYVLQGRALYCGAATDAGVELHILNASERYAPLLGHTPRDTSGQLSDAVIRSFRMD